MDSNDQTQRKRQADRKYNVEKEHKKITETFEDVREFFMYIKLALALEEDLTTTVSLINPPFDPLQTFGKYSA